MTINLGMAKPADGNIVWGLGQRDNLDTLDAAIRSHNFAEAPLTHSGLNFGHKGGVIRSGSAIAIVAAGTTLLADNQTNYVEVNRLGAVTDNIVGFTPGRVPLFIVVTLAGAISVITDCRSWIVPIAEEKPLALSIPENPLTMATNKVLIVPNISLTVLTVHARVITAPTGLDLIIDLHKNGITMFTTQANRPTILAGNSSVTSVAPDITSIAVGDYLTIDVDQVGNVIPGAILGVTINCVYP